jgi:hypothetical protein
VIVMAGSATAGAGSMGAGASGLSLNVGGNWVVVISCVCVCENEGSDEVFAGGVDDDAFAIAADGRVSISTEWEGSPGCIEADSERCGVGGDEEVGLGVDIASRDCDRSALPRQWRSSVHLSLERRRGGVTSDELRWRVIQLCAAIMEYQCEQLMCICLTV